VPVSLFVLSQFIAAVSFFLDVISFHFKETTTTLRILSVSTLLLSVHFALLDEYTSSLMMMIACCRFVIASITANKKFLLFFMLLSLFGCIFTWEGSKDALPLLAGLIMNYAAFQKGEIKVRCYTMIGSAFWIVSNLIAHSPVAFLMELSFFLSTAFSLMKKLKSRDCAI
jgi:Bacterial inner membrane protein